MTTAVPTVYHQWTKYSVSEVDVIVDPEGRSFAVDRPDSAVGEQVGCNVCGEPLADGSVWTRCTGPDDTP